jgi:citrate lyase beta subunit
VSDINYPNREHANADKAARRRAISALDSIEANARALARRIEDGSYEPHGEDAQRFAEATVKVAVNLGALETLRDVREWHAADEAEARP